jgi:hypothetical protein
MKGFILQDSRPIGFDSAILNIAITAKGSEQIIIHHK